MITCSDDGASPVSTIGDVFWPFLLGLGLVRVSKRVTMDYWFVKPMSVVVCLDNRVLHVCCEFV